MRTTVDLPPAIHSQVRRLALKRGTSMSSVIAELTSRGLRESREDAPIATDPKTGLPVLDFGRPITAAEVDVFLSEND